MNRRQARQSPVRRRREASRWVVLAAAMFFAGLLTASSWAAAPDAAAQPASTTQAPAPQSAAAPPTAPAPVWVTKATGIIDPALASYLTKTMKQAADAQAAALVIEIDTPGGLDTAMRQIIQGELDSPIPVVVYVYPEGARAASAGVYILMGSDVAAMAPQTNLGAATPVALNGTMDDTMKAKVTNDAAAYIIALAKNHDRNATWAEQAVRQSVSLPADQALAQNVVDFVEPDLTSLLKAMDGFVTQPKGLVMHTAGAPVKEVEMGWTASLLHAIANPDIAYILMTIGILGIIFEIAAPGHILSGVAGVIALLLAFYGLAVLPVNFVGIALIVLAMILFIAEMKVQSHGVLGIGGAVALILGGLLLFNSSASYLKVGWPVLIIVALLAFSFFMLVVAKVRGALRRPLATGPTSLVGEHGVTLSPLDPKGQVQVRGEIWKARTEGEALLRDERIAVLRVEGLTLVVHRLTGPDEGSQMELAPEH
jgi:membrane-bound serine protease (ClpP class)